MNMKTSKYLDYFLLFLNFLWPKAQGRQIQKRYKRDSRTYRSKRQCKTLKAIPRVLSEKIMK